MAEDEASDVKEDIFIQEVQRRVIQLFLKMEGILGFSPESDLGFSVELNKLTRNIVNRNK